MVNYEKLKEGDQLGEGRAAEPDVTFSFQQLSKKKPGPLSGIHCPVFPGHREVKYFLFPIRK